MCDRAGSSNYVLLTPALAREWLATIKDGDRDGARYADIMLAGDWRPGSVVELYRSELRLSGTTSSEVTPGTLQPHPADSMKQPSDPWDLQPQPGIPTR
jgi:hypothetical protein